MFDDNLGSYSPIPLLGFQSKNFLPDLHSEAVQQALVKHGKSKRIPVVPVGLKRSSLVAHNLHADDTSGIYLLANAVLLPHSVYYFFVSC